MRKNNSSNPSPLLGLNALTASRSPRAPKADVSNADYLMGDVASFEEDGDVFEDDAPYGDVSTTALDTYNSLIGDVDDEAGPYGAPKRKGAFGRTAKAVAPYALGAGAAVGSAALISKMIKRHKARKAAMARTIAQNSRRNTIANQVMARRLMGQIPRNTKMPFYQISGATLNSYPLAPTEYFAANDLKFNLDRQSTETPFEAEIVNGTFAGVTWTLSATGVVASRYYPCVVINIGISTLTANPGTIFTLVGTMPTINGGVLTIAANPFSFTISQGWYAKLMIFPWILVTNKPLLALGAYNNANPISFNITGLPSNATVNMVVPGSQYVWTIGMRNRLV